VPSENFALTRHAKARLRERKISRKEVGLVLESPDLITPAKAGKTNYWRTVDGRRLRVTVLETEAGKIVITAVLPDREDI